MRMPAGLWRGQWQRACGWSYHLQTVPASGQCTGKTRCSDCSVPKIIIKWWLQGALFCYKAVSFLFHRQGESADVLLCCVWRLWWLHTHTHTLCLYLSLSLSYTHTNTHTPHIIKYINDKHPLSSQWQHSGSWRVYCRGQTLLSAAAFSWPEIYKQLLQNWVSGGRPTPPLFCHF